MKKALLAGSLITICFGWMGEAKAWTPLGIGLGYSTYEDPTVPTTFDLNWSPWLGDKKVRIVSGYGPLAQENTFKFEYEPLSANPWQVSLNTVGGNPANGQLDYQINLDNTQNGLNICTTYGTCGPAFATVSNFSDHPGDWTQTIWGGTSPTGTPLVIINGAQSANLTSLGGQTDLYVRLQWSELKLSSNITSGYNQVPAPLPILGAATVFGSVRRLGRASKKLRSASQA